MPLKNSPRVVFARNVLDGVVCQLRFPPILSITAAEPASFQEAIRSSYPLYRREEGIGLPEELKEILAQFPAARMAETTRHIFSNESQTRSIVLAKDFIAIDEGSYTRWENFRGEIERAVSALVRSYQPAFFTRVGLRYRNTIDRSKLPAAATLHWDELIDAALLGLLSDAELKDSVSVMVTKTLLRFDPVKNASIGLQHGLRRNEDDSGFVYFIDADFFQETKSNYGQVFDCLAEFNRGAGNLFRHAITNTLYRALEPMELAPNDSSE